MKLPKSYLRAAAFLLIIAAWFFYNNVIKSEDVKADPAPAAKESVMPTVVYEMRTASDHEKMLSLYGRTEAAREVTIKAETAGVVVSTPATEGRKIARGATVCRQDVDARQAMLDQASANYKAIEVDLKAARTLAEKGYQSSTRVTAIEAQLDGAQAAITSAKIELDNVSMRAPFAGIWERQMAEIGDYLSAGQPCGLLVELSPLIVRAELTEGQVGLIKTGQSASVKLATGQSLDGTVRLIQSKANTMTRTFSMEITVPNLDYSLKSGVTATVRISAGKTKAQLIPSAILALNDAGDVGVRYLDSQDRVVFAAVTTIDEEANGIWVTGLPDTVRILIKGQGFVSDGTQVAPTLNSANKG